MKSEDRQIRFCLCATHGNFSEVQRGSFMLFFAAGILPLLLIMMGLFIDITNYLRAEQKLQENADDAAMLAWRYLPYRAMATDAVYNFLSSRGLGSSVEKIGLAPARPGMHDYADEFEVILNQKFTPSFMSYFGTGWSVPLRSVARTKSTPQDIYIALDRSFYVAPRSPADIWPESVSSDYFESFKLFNKLRDPESGSYISDPPAAFMTQLCFNPYFAGMKKAAITLYEYFSAFGRNGVGLGVYPGPGLENLRNIRDVLRPAQNADPSVQNSGEAIALQILPLRNSQDYFLYHGIPLGASSWCAAAAAESSDFRTYYPYDYASTSGIKKIWQAGYAASSSITRFDGDEIVFNPDYQGALSVNEALWSAVAKALKPNFPEVLEAIISQLAYGPDFEREAGGPIREGLTGTSTRTAVILAGDVPYADGARFNTADDDVAHKLSESFNKLRQITESSSDLKFRIVYVLIDDQQLRPLNADLAGLEQRAEALSEFFEEQGRKAYPGSGLDLQLMHVNNLQYLTEQIIGMTVTNKRRAVISY